MQKSGRLYKDTKLNKVTYFKTIFRVAFHTKTGAAAAQVTSLYPHQVLKNSSQCSRGIREPFALGGAAGVTELSHDFTLRVPRITLVLTFKCAQTDQGFRISHQLGKGHLKTKLLFVSSNSKQDYETAFPQGMHPPLPDTPSGRQAGTRTCKRQQHSFHFSKLSPWHHYKADKAFHMTHLLQNASEVTNCFQYFASKNINAVAAQLQCWVVDGQKPKYKFRRVGRSFWCTPTLYTDFFWTFWQWRSDKIIQMYPFFLNKGRKAAVSDPVFMPNSTV